MGDYSIVCTRLKIKVNSSVKIKYSVLSHVLRLWWEYSVSVQCFASVSGFRTENFVSSFRDRVSGKTWNWVELDKEISDTSLIVSLQPQHMRNLRKISLNLAVFPAGGDEIAWSSSIRANSLNTSSYPCQLIIMFVSLSPTCLTKGWRAEFSKSPIHLPISWGFGIKTAWSLVSLTVGYHFYQYSM